MTYPPDPVESRGSEPDEKAAPLVYVMMERDYYPDSVWWTETEARERQAELKEKSAGAYHEVRYYRVGEAS